MVSSRKNCLILKFLPAFMIDGGFGCDSLVITDFISTVSMVLNRNPHCRHSRRRLMLSQ